MYNTFYDKLNINNKKKENTCAWKGMTKHERKSITNTRIS